MQLCQKRAEEGDAQQALPDTINTRPEQTLREVYGNDSDVLLTRIPLMFATALSVVGRVGIFPEFPRFSPNAFIKFPGLYDTAGVGTIIIIKKMVVTASPQF